MEDFLEDLRNFDAGTFDPSELLTDKVQWYKEYGVDAPTKDKFWITNGTETKMIQGDIPDGWVKGRGKVLSEEGKKKCINHLTHNNPNAKKYRIDYRDGTSEVVTQLSTWARENGHKYTNIKAIVRRSKYKKEKQFECYNSPTYYIRQIVPIG